MAGGKGNSEAHAAYLKGRYAFLRYDPKALVEALSQFERASALEPGIAEALAQQAYCRTTLYVFGLPGADTSLANAEALVRRAIGLAPRSALAHARLGWVLGYGGVLSPVQEAFETALGRDPENAEVAVVYGETLNRLARPDRAEEMLARAFARDFYFPPSWECARGHSKRLRGDMTGVNDDFHAVLARVERIIPARVQSICALCTAGREAEAREEQAVLRRLAPRYSGAHAQRMFPYPEPKPRDALETALDGVGLG